MFGQIQFNSNPCDHGWSELIIHMTKKCDNKCPFCISNNDGDLGYMEPDVDKICKTIKENCARNPYVIINGGEPFLYLEKVNQIVDFVHQNTDCKVYVFSSIPVTCITQFELFEKVVGKLDGFIISAQHYNDEIADLIRGKKSYHNRHYVYEHLRHKENTVISLNIVKPYYKTKGDVIKNLEYFYNLGYKNFKLVEIKDNEEYFIDVPKFLGVKVKSPFAYKCSPVFKLSEFLEGAEGTVKLNLTCFLRNPKYKTSTIWDLIKSVLRPLFSKHGHLFGVVYEDGSIHPYWISKN